MIHGVVPGSIGCRDHVRDGCTIIEWYCRTFLALSLLFGISIGLASSVPSILTLRFNLWQLSSSGYFAFSLAKAADFSQGPDLLNSG